METDPQSGSGCSNRTLKESVQAICESECASQQIPSCEVRTYSLRERSVATANDRYMLRCYVPSFQFPVFEEKLAIDWQTFLAQFGGCLGLYLGISMASLLHIPVFFARQLGKFASKKWLKS